MVRNYYVTLGVEASATPEQIKTAYRRKAKKFHPDHYGHDSQPFRELREAYDVLSDPIRRRAYDEALAREQQPPSRRVAPARWARPVAAEPLTPSAEPNKWVEPLFGQPDPRISPTVETLFDFLRRDFRRQVGFEPDRDADFQVEIRLSLLQAQRGGEVHVRLPVSVHCPACGGSGGLGCFGCRRCAGRGTISAEYPLALRYPAGIANGDTARLSLQRWGIPGYLTVFFRLID